MSTITNTMFESIKTALAKNNNTSSRNKDILKLEVGNTYTVRLLPNVKEPAKTFFHYYTFGWTSFATGQYVSAISPTTFGERDPIAEARYRILKTGTEEDKAKARAILRTEKWLVNAYVINDPVNEANTGKTMIVRYGKQLHKIISDAIEGEGAEDLGARIFDLTDKGSSLKIKVEQQGDFPTYVSSKFSLPKAIEGVDKKKADEIYKNTFELETVFPVKSYDELKTMLEEHYYCKSESTPAPSKRVEAATPVVAEQEVLEDETVQKLLAGLDEN